MVQTEINPFFLVLRSEKLIASIEVSRIFSHSPPLLGIDHSDDFVCSPCNLPI